MSTDVQVPEKKDGRGGARAGAGRPALPENVQRYRHAARILSGRYVSRAWKRLHDIAEDPAHPDHYKALIECLDRGGLPKIREIEESDDARAYAPLIKAISGLVEEKVAQALNDLSKLAVVATEADYEVTTPNGNGEPNGTVQ